MQSIYKFLDKLGFSNKDFETLGLLIQVYSGISLFLAVYFLYALIILGGEITSLIGLFSNGLDYFSGFGFIVGILIFMLLIAIALIGLMFMAGKKAKENYNKPESADSLKTWAIYLAVILGINILTSLTSLTFGTFILKLIEIFVVILYFYFIDRMAEFNDPQFVEGTVIERAGERKQSQKISTPVNNPFDNSNNNVTNNQETNSNLNSSEDNLDSNLEADDTEGIVVNNEEIK